MKPSARRIAIGATACMALLPVSESRTPPKKAEPVIQMEDVDRFYQLYDRTGGHPTVEQLQHDYLDPGSEGLHQFAKLRNVTASRIAENLSTHPEAYANAKTCMTVLPHVRSRLKVALHTLGRVYPEAQFPPVTIVVGRGKPVGMTSVAGVQIGLEALCAAEYSLSKNVENRFVHVIAHEYGHIQQLQVVANDEHPTVLEAALAEGGGELTAELISGEIGYSQLAEWTQGREKDIETQFEADEDKTDLSKWFYNGRGTADWPGDLGYWVGYRIVKTYYQHARDKRRAFREVLEVSDPKLFVQKSGWYPGIRLE
jgi:hypothetical protein